MSKDSGARKIELRPSYALAAILIIAHAVAIAIVTIVSIPPWFTLIALATLGLSLLFYVRFALLIDGRSIVALEIGLDDTVCAHTRREGELQCEVEGSSYVNAFLAVINLTVSDRNRHKHVVVLPDSIDPEEFRQLRVWLRWTPRKPQHPRIVA